MYLCMYVCMYVNMYICMDIRKHMDIFTTYVWTQNLGVMPDVKTYEKMPQPEVKISDTGSRTVVVGGCTIRHNEVMYACKTVINSDRF